MAIVDTWNTSVHPVQIRTYSLQLQVRRTTGWPGHPQHGLGDRFPRPPGPGGHHRGIDLPDGEDSLSPTDGQHFASWRSPR
jgi:hypothetical protein